MANRSSAASLGSAGRTARGHAASWRSTLARTGLVGRAMLYGVFALLAINIATGQSGSTTQGAIERIASQTFGQVLLIVLSFGLIVLVAWKVLQAIAGDPVSGSEPTDRLKYVASAVSYGGVATASVAVLLANRSSGSDDTRQEATATVLSWPGGRFLVMAGGLAVIGFAGVEFYKKVVQTEFMDRLDVGKLSSAARDGVETAGRAGFSAKVATTAIVGGFLMVAGIQYDPSETTGLSGALQEVADATAGQALLWAMAAGFLLFAVFCLAEAKLRRAT